MYIVLLDRAVCQTL